MMKAFLPCVAFVFLTLVQQDSVDAVALNLFYPFGPEVSDSTLRPGDDISSPEIDLDEDIVFYNKSYRSLYINVNGHVSFESEVPAYRADIPLPHGLHIIAVFLADIDTTASGRIYYRSTSEEAILQRAAADIQTYFSGFESFMPTSLFIATWDRVGYYMEGSDRVNTFQLVVASDGTNSFTIFHYLDDGIQWMASRGKYAPTEPDIPPQAGFENGKGGLAYPLPGSGLTGTFSDGSNVNVAGVWMYQIGNLGTGNVRPADLNTAQVTLFDIGAPQQDSCFQSASTCSANAQCIDNDNGFCCACLPPYYGNGLSCLEPGVAQKVNGPVNGTLNGVRLDDGLSMHTYVVTTDGRTYSAIARIPQNIGTAMLTLNSIGGIIGWLFAAPLNPQAKNGYHFTGGKFNRTAKITFQFADRADLVVRLYQRFRGHDSLNNIRMDTYLEGDLPDIPPGSVVSIDDYNENYKRTAPGVVKSFVARTYRVNDVAYRYTWDNTISYEECDDGQPRTASDVMRLRVSRHYVKLNPSDQVVRFAMTSKVGVFAGSDPCYNAAQKCSAQAECVPNGESYQCVCRSGYRGDGSTCQDVDECQESPCDENALCYNVEGSFQCQCQSGFSGDGRTCRQDVQACGQQICSSNARCVFLNETSQPRCQCNVGFRGDGVRCAPIEYSCNEADICGENAQCVYDEDLREYVCECVDEFSGDGFSCEQADQGCGNCDRFAQCILDISTNRYKCQCNPGYSGDGATCSLIDTCADCDRNARCLFNDATSDYECVCVRGYAGDGNTCTLRDCRDDPGMCDQEGGLCWLDESRDVGICRCNYGYRGDGFRCEKTNCDVYNDCDANAKCVPDGDSFRCQCNEGYIGSGKRCRVATTGGCEELNDCDANARCLQDPRDETRYMCRCNPGFQGDGKICQRRVVPCNQVNNCDRNAECMYDPDQMSYKCVCARGFEGNGIECRRKQVNDCRRTPSMCGENAECVQGTEEAYVCVCSPGFRGDGGTCSPVVREGNFLIYAQGSKIMRVTSEARRGDYGQQLVYIPGQLAVGVATDCLNADLYWTDAARGAILRSRMDGTNVQTIITGLKSPEGIAVDHSGRNLFFTDSELDTLQVSRLDGSDIRTLVGTDMINPRAIVLDVRRGVIYWTDWNRNRPQIERINMDGTERTVLVTDGLRLPNGLAFDSFSQTLCWGDAGTKSIECIRSDGVGRRRVYDQASYPFDITVLNNVVFWTDWERKDIPNINQNGREPNQPLNLAIGGHGKTYGITAVRDQCPSESNSCSLNNGGCKFLCLPSPNGGRTCACPDGVDPRICQN